MKLQDLEELMHYEGQEFDSVVAEKKAEFESLIQREAKTLTVSDIKEGFAGDDREQAIHDYADEASKIDENKFAYGQTLEFEVPPRSSICFKISIKPHQLTVTGYHGIHIAQFEGSAVKAFYDELIADIATERKRILDNLPF
jgi:hypothetical protein